MADNILSAKIQVTAPGVQKTFNDVATATGKTQAALQKLPAATNSANQSLINFGRVVQDAPFGIIGIANNIDPLVSSFQRLRTETGSVGGAFSSLAKGLIGPAGIAIAVSTITSALITFGGSLFGAGDAAKRSEEALRSYGETIDDIKDSVDGLSTSLQFLNKLGSLNIDIRGLGEVTDLREQVIAQREFTFGLTQERERLKAVQQQIVSDTKLTGEDRVKALEDAADDLEAVNKKITDSENTERLLYRQIQLQKNKDAEEAQKKAKSDYEKYANATIAKAKELAAFFNRITIRQIGFDTDPRDSLGQQLNKALAFIEQVLNRRQEFKVKSAFFDFEQVDLAFRKMNFKGGAAFADFSTALKPISDQLNREVERLTRNNPILKLSFKFELDRERAAREAQELMDSIGRVIQDAAIQGISGLSEALGEALAGGDIKKGFQQFARVIAQGFIEIGKQMIAAAPVIKALRAAVRSLNPTILLAAGVALVAIGAVLRKSFDGARALGGPVKKGGAYLVGENGPELFVPDTGGSIVSNSNLSASERSGFSGGMAIAVEGVFIQRGNDLVAAISSTQRSQNRLR
jgi:hypothetical protein